MNPKLFILIESGIILAFVLFVVFQVVVRDDRLLSH